MFSALNEILLSKILLPFIFAYLYRSKHPTEQRHKASKSWSDPTLYGPTNMRSQITTENKKLEL